METITTLELMFDFKISTDLEALQEINNPDDEHTILIHTNNVDRTVEDLKGMVNSPIRFKESDRYLGGNIASLMYFIGGRNLDLTLNLHKAMMILGNIKAASARGSHRSILRRKDGYVNIIGMEISPERTVSISEAVIPAILIPSNISTSEFWIKRPDAGDFDVAESIKEFFGVDDYDVFLEFDGWLAENYTLDDFSTITESDCIRHLSHHINRRGAKVIQDGYSRIDSSGKLLLNNASLRDLEDSDFFDLGDYEIKGSDSSEIDKDTMEFAVRAYTSLHPASNINSDVEPNELIRLISWDLNSLIHPIEGLEGLSYSRGGIDPTKTNVLWISEDEIPGWTTLLELADSNMVFGDYNRILPNGSLQATLPFATALQIKNVELNLYRELSNRSESEILDDHQGYYEDGKLKCIRYVDVFDRRKEAVFDLDVTLRKTNSMSYHSLNIENVTLI